MSPSALLPSVAERLLGRLPPRLADEVRRSPRVRQLAADAAMLVAQVTGETQPSATVFRGADPTAELLALRVVDVRDETHDTRTILFARPAGFSAEPGQFLTFHLHGPAGPIRRSYSLSGGAADGPLAVTVKRLPGGVGSALMHALRPGDVARARGPLGSFVLRGAGALVLVAGGSGVTPIVALLEAALSEPATRSVHLLYACRSARDVIFAERVLARARSDARLRVTLFLEEPGGDALAPAEVRAGRLDRAALVAAAAGTGEPDVHLCGPAEMMELARGWLAEAGVPAERVHQERFGSPKAQRGARLVGEGEPRKLRLGRAALTVLPGETLLEASVREGRPIDSSCTMGGCGACRVRLVSGEVALEEPNCLTAEERASGVILSCVARPLTDVTVAPLGGA